jgi:hypothetical protein
MSDDDSINGENTGHTARPAPGRPGAWEVSWLPGRLMSRNTAITALVLADTLASGPVQPGDRLWPHVEGWAEEIGLTASEAVARITEADHANAGMEAEPEAGG